VAEALRSVLAEHAPSEAVGVTCLARGADQVFARAVHDLGGAVEVALPAADCRERKVKPGNAAEFDELIGRAARVRTLAFDESNRDAYMAASEDLLSSVDAMVAVWDGGRPVATAARPTLWTPPGTAVFR
jgi:hypothetical protein